MCRPQIHYSHYHRLGSPPNVYSTAERGKGGGGVGDCSAPHYTTSSNNNHAPNAVALYSAGNHNSSEMRGKKPEYVVSSMLVAFPNCSLCMVICFSSHDHLPRFADSTCRFITMAHYFWTRDARYGSFPKQGGSQYIDPNKTSLITGNPQKELRILGNPHINSATRTLLGPPCYPNSSETCMDPNLMVHLYWTQPKPQPLKP